MSRIKNYYHEELENRDGEADGVYPCSSCNQPIVRGRLCDACLAEIRDMVKKEKKTTIEKAADELENMLEANRKYHTTKPPWEKRK